VRRDGHHLAGSTLGLETAYVCIVLTNVLSELWGSSRMPASGNGSVTVCQYPEASGLTAATAR